jgi:hypothetical protein
MTTPKVNWPKLVEGHTYSWTMTWADRAPIERTWTVRGPKTIDSAAHFRQVVARWAKKGWTVTVEEVPEAPVSPVEPLDASEAPSTPPQPSEAPVSAKGAMVGVVIGHLEREEDGYCYVEGLTQALRRGWDIDANAHIGDMIECTYARRTYGFGWYGTVLGKS